MNDYSDILNQLKSNTESSDQVLRNIQRSVSDIADSYAGQHAANGSYIPSQSAMRDRRADARDSRNASKDKWKAKLYNAFESDLACCFGISKDDYLKTNITFHYSSSKSLDQIEGAMPIYGGPYKFSTCVISNTDEENPASFGKNNGICYEKTNLPAGDHNGHTLGRVPNPRSENHRTLFILPQHNLQNRIPRQLAENI